MFFVLSSFALGNQGEPSFQWNMGLRVGQSLFQLGQLSLGAFEIYGPGDAADILCNASSIYYSI